MAESSPIQTRNYVPGSGIEIGTYVNSRGVRMTRLDEVYQRAHMAYMDDSANMARCQCGWAWFDEDRDVREAQAFFHQVNLTPLPPDQMSEAIDSIKARRNKND